MNKLPLHIKVIMDNIFLFFLKCTTKRGRSLTQCDHANYNFITSNNKYIYWIKQYSGSTSSLSALLQGLSETCITIKPFRNLKNVLNEFEERILKWDNFFLDHCRYWCVDFVTMSCPEADHTLFRLELCILRRRTHIITPKN